jgi:hypothetical protein
MSRCRGGRNEDNRFDILDLHSRWLMDAGCGTDLMPKDLVGVREELLVNAKPIEFHTANGHVSAAETLPCAASGLRSLDTDPYVMQDTLCCFNGRDMREGKLLGYMA